MICFYTCYVFEMSHENPICLRGSLRRSSDSNILLHTYIKKYDFKKKYILNIVLVKIDLVQWT